MPAAHLNENQFFYAIRLCWFVMKIFSFVLNEIKVIQKTNFQGQWTVGEMIIQNGLIEPKIVSIICVAIFLICATPLLKLGAENTPILSEISK